LLFHDQTVLFTDEILWQISEVNQRFLKFAPLEQEYFLWESLINSFMIESSGEIENAISSFLPILIAYTS
ncbi:hypothetical protein, partial [Sessilibacter sp. MAH4]